MGAKEDFITEFLTDLPEGLQNHLDTTIPTLVATSGAYDAEHPTRNSETLSHNLNLIFKAFEGLPLAAIPLFIGQLNTVNQGMLFAALEFVGGSGDIKILAPVDGGNYLGHFGITELYRAQVIRGDVESISVSVASDTFDLVQDDNDPTLWTGEWATAIGSHTATFSATLTDSSTVEESVSFLVKSYPTYPADGDVVPEGQNFSVTLDSQGDDDIQSVNVTITNEDTEESFNETLEKVDALWETVVDVARMGVGGVYVIAFKIAHNVLAFEKQVTFVYGTDPLQS